MAFAGHAAILARPAGDNGRMQPVTPAKTHPYSALTPDVVQDALASIGLWGDGRLAALNSFENRVYQVHLEDAFEGHTQVVAKFYRPARWSDAQIAEEHAFAMELQAAEIPAVRTPGGSGPDAAPLRRLCVCSQPAARRAAARAGKL